jgi:hypothetical protein
MASWAADVKYTDTDVRSDENLRAIATQFAQGYNGDFEFLVSAKEVAIVTDDLPITMARGVLNCMRGDARGHQLLPPPKPTWGSDSEEEPIQQSMPYPRRWKKAEVVELPIPRRVRELKVHWNKIYVLSTHKQGKVAHLLWPERSKLTYYPNGWRATDDIYHAWLHLHCGNHMDTRFLLTNDTQGRPMCKSCVCMAEMRNA